jgi:outer membrane receptor protein involved in Fe transport
MSPKFGLVIGPFENAEFYANWGRGFHSNDARGATAAVDPVPLLVQARGGEVGARTKLLPGWQSSVSLWTLGLDSELVFIGDAGVTEPKGASTRHGVEWSNRFAPIRGVVLDADIAWSRARFKQADNGGRFVPNAVPLTASVSATVDHAGPWFGGVRLRYLGAYALEESGQQRSTAFWMTNLKVGYRIGPAWQLSVDVLNLFDKRANDIEYWGGACSRPEIGTPACGIDDRLVHPLEPRSVRLSMRLSF